MPRSDGGHIRSFHLDELLAILIYPATGEP